MMNILIKVIWFILFINIEYTKVVIRIHKTKDRQDNH